jgi:hypothetical protein
MKYIKKLLVVWVSASVYYLSLLVNEWVLGDSEFSFDVHWVFFPSGFRFLLVLLALESGALGIALSFLGLDSEFKVLSPQTLLKISLLFATLSALLHQLWFYSQGLTENLALSFTVMALSNWAGTLLVLLAMKFIIQKYSSPETERQKF